MWFRFPSFIFDWSSKISTTSWNMVNVLVHPINLGGAPPKMTVLGGFGGTRIFRIQISSAHAPILFWWSISLTWKVGGTLKWVWLKMIGS